MKAFGRQCNMELCRIIAMSMIVFYHYLHYVLNVTRDSNITLIFLQSFSLCGVNLFFLISGYFNIRLTSLKIINLFAIIFILQLLNYFGVYCLDHNNKINLLSIIFFPISKSPYWFIQVYLLLMLCSPVVNIGLTMLSDKALRFTVSILTFATIYSCAIGHNLSNPNGYSFLQGLYVYILGQWIRRDKIMVENLSKLNLIFLYVLLCIVAGIGFYLIGSPFWISYNGFPILFASIAIFSVFIKSEIANSSFFAVLGKSSLFVYLLQDGLFGQYFFYQWQKNIIEQMNGLSQIVLFFFICFISTWILSIITCYIVNKFISKLDQYSMKYFPVLGEDIV